MTTDEIARFLRTHPKFFDQHPELLESIQVPHPYGGRAIALSERQALALREKVKLLEAKLAEIIKFADENDVISEKVHRLSVALAGASTRRCSSLPNTSIASFTRSGRVPTYMPIWPLSR